MSTRRRGRRWFRRRSAEDFAREIEAHVEIEADRLIEEGLPAEAARLAARRRFGNVTTAKERFYEARRLLWLDHLRQDTRSAVRNMRRAPLAAIVAVASLAAGIGATTVTFSIRDVIFYKPPPLYRDPGQLSKVQVAPAERRIMPFGGQVPASLYATWHDTLGSSIGASMALPGVRDVRTGDRIETAPVRTVTAGFFSLLGVSAELGQVDVGSLRRRGDAAPAVLSHRLWQRLFDGRADALGQVVWIENQPYTVAGVLPQGFWFAEMNSPVWTRLEVEEFPAGAYDVVVRRPADVTAPMLEAQLRRGLAEYAARQPAGQRQFLMRVSGLEGTPLGNQMSLVLPYLLGTSALLTLLIACANVAILLIAQWTIREHEIAVRASIGGSRGRIVRSLLTESMVIAAAGGALGVCATLALRGWVLSRSGGDVAFFNLSIDPVIFVRTAALAIASGILVGIAPALYETRRLHANPLRTLAGSDRVRQRWRNALVVFEITVTVALLVETGAMVEGYQRARAGQMGFPTESLMTARVENPRGVSSAAVLDVLKGLPEVAAASVSTGAGLFGGGGQQVHVSADATGRNAVTCDRTLIGADYFSTLGVQMMAGRGFEDRDTAARVAIVNETLARRVLPQDEPLTARIWIGQTSYEVAGIVADYTTNPLRYPDIEPQIFLPLAARPTELTRLSVVVRAKGNPATLIRPIRQEVRDSLAGTVVTGAYTVDQILSVIGEEILIGTAPLFPLIAIGVLLTTAGIYGVLAFAIARRSRELALRIAIGATRADLVRLVSAQALRLVAMGTATGSVVTFGLARAVRAGGGAGSVYDPGVAAFVAPVLIVLAIGVVAAWMPARRASTTDPAALLRTT